MINIKRLTRKTSCYSQFARETVLPTRHCSQCNKTLPGNEERQAQQRHGYKSSTINYTQHMSQQIGFLDIKLCMTAKHMQFISLLTT